MAGLADILEGDAAQLIREAGDAYVAGATAALIAWRDGKT